MACLVAGFYVQVDEVIGFQRFECGSGLVLIVGVVQAGGTLYLQSPQACIVADAVDQVDGRDDSSFVDLGIFLVQRLHLWTITGAPWPNAVGRVLAFGLALQVDRMVLEQFLRAYYQVVYEGGRLCGCQFGTAFGLGDVFRARQGFYHQRTVGLEWNIVGRGTGNALVTALDDQQVAILHARVEVYPLVP